MNQISNLHFELYRDPNGWGFGYRLVDDRNRVFLEQQGFLTVRACLQTIQEVRQYAAQDDLYDRRQDGRSHNWSFTLRDAKTWRKLGYSPMFSGIMACERIIDVLKQETARASVPAEEPRLRLMA